MSKEEIILGRLSRLVPYQQPVSLLAENGVRQDLTSVVSNPLEERLPEEEEQHQDLSQKLVTTVGNHSHEQDANIAFPRDVPEEERLPESPSASCRGNRSCLSPEHSQSQRVITSLDATSHGRSSQGKMVSKNVPTAGCERKPSSSPGYCQDEQNQTLVCYRLIRFRDPSHVKTHLSVVVVPKLRRAVQTVEMSSNLVPVETQALRLLL